LAKPPAPPPPPPPGLCETSLSSAAPLGCGDSLPYEGSEDAEASPPPVRENRWNGTASHTCWVSIRVPGYGCIHTCKWAVEEIRLKVAHCRRGLRAHRESSRRVESTKLLYPVLFRCRLAAAELASMAMASVACCNGSNAAAGIGRVAKGWRGLLSMVIRPRSQYFPCEVENPCVLHFVALVHYNRYLMAPDKNPIATNAIPAGRVRSCKVLFCR
jgi:hypothetical protein